MTRLPPPPPSILLHSHHHFFSCSVICLLTIVLLFFLFRNLWRQQMASVDAFFKIPKPAARSVYGMLREFYLCYINSSQRPSNLLHPETTTRTRHFSTQFARANWQFLHNIVLRLLVVVSVIIMLLVLLVYCQETFLAKRQLTIEALSLLDDTNYDMYTLTVLTVEYARPFGLLPDPVLLELLGTIVTRVSFSFPSAAVSVCTFFFFFFLILYDYCISFSESGRAHKRHEHCHDFWFGHHYRCLAYAALRCFAMCAGGNQLSPVVGLEVFVQVLGHCVAGEIRCIVLITVRLSLMLCAR